MTRSSFKRAALRALRSVGGFALAGRLQLWRNRLLVLCYHGISQRDEHRWLPSLYLSAEHFRQRLGLLKACRMNVLPLEEAVVRLQKRSLPPRSAVITFDDGFLDFFSQAIPILREFGYPSTLYLTTHYCKHRVPVFSLAVSYMLWKTGREAADLRSFGLSPAASLRTARDRTALMEALRAWAIQNELSTVAQNEAAARLAEALRFDYEEFLRGRLLQLMSPEEVNRASRCGVDIQLHTHRHRVPRQRELFLREVCDNRRCILEWTGRDPGHFCYPSGELAPEFLPWLRECGVRSAATCLWGTVGIRSDLLLLPRALDSDTLTPVEFESWLCGVHP